MGICNPLSKLGCQISSYKQNTEFDILCYVKMQSSSSVKVYIIMCCIGTRFNKMLLFVNHITCDHI